MKKYTFRRTLFTNQAPGGNDFLTQHPNSQVSVQVYQYNQNDLKNYTCKVSDLTFDDKSEYWIHIVHPKEQTALHQIAHFFQINSIHIEDVLELGQRGKYESTEHYEFFILTQINYDESTQGIVQEQLAVFKFHEGIVITIHEDDSDSLNNIRQRILHPQSRIRKFGSEYLILSIFDAIVDNYFPALKKISDKIDTIEERVFIGEGSKQLLSDLYQCKRELLLLRRHIWPMREIVNSFAQRDKLNIKLEPVHKDIYNQIVEVVDIIDNLRETTSSILDIHLSTTAHKTNEIMKFMTVLSGIFVPVTFIAGIYGMNFENMPELKMKYAYFVVLGFMGLVIGFLLYLFKRRKWI
ncbi:MAG: magnesium/cobalt transporter CorA [Bacteroidia bacterium]|nr:magnesium/cobalt transporter CorA [Bacteroidia bacterium]